MTTEQIVFKLDKPFELDGKTFTEFTFREPTMKDLFLAEKMAGAEAKLNETILTLACVVSNTHRNVFEALPIKVFYKIKEALEPFFN